MSGSRARADTQTIYRDTRILLSQLHVYPIKSMGGISLKASDVDEHGLRHDRRWMLVDETGLFISQRELPRMALIGVRIEPDRLMINAPHMPALELPLGPTTGKTVLAQVWDDVVEASPVGEDADRWFGECLGVRCSLVYLSDESVRLVDPDYGNPGDQVSLADGFPFLLVSEASLAELNSRLEQPVLMNRFRPNLVVRGCEAFAEDGWRVVRIGPITLRVVKACSRCTITTMDQTTAVTGKEPLRTLARFRKVGNKVLFGQNLIHDETGTLRIGDPVKILQTR